MSKNDRIRAVGYARVSTDEQAEQGISIPLQKSRITSYCQAKGWHLEGFYVDDGYSGKNLERKDMPRLIDDSKTKNFDIVVVVKLDRLSRKQRDIMYLIEDVFTPNTIEFASVTENFDTTTSMGRAMLGIMAVFAQLERETIVERVLSAKEEAAKQGRFGGGDAPYGYDYDKTKNKDEKRLMPSERAETVQLIYDLYTIDKHGFKMIANILNEKRISTPKGSKKWDHSCVRFILGNPHYIGYVHRCGIKYPGKHKAIIPREQWDEAQEMMKSRYRPRPTKDPNNLLTGIIWCAECGARMRFKTHGQTGMQHYVCYSKLGDYQMSRGPCDSIFQQAIKINDDVVKKLMRYSANERMARNAVMKKVGSAPTHEKVLKVLRKEFASIQSKIERWEELYEKGDAEPDLFVDRVKSLRLKRVDIENQILEIEAQEQKENSRAASAEELLLAIKDFRFVWEEANPDERRTMITNMLKFVKVKKDGTFDFEFEE
jgi:site-specific DNA recombinase